MTMNFWKILSKSKLSNRVLNEKGNEDDFQINCGICQ